MSALSATLLLVAEDEGAREALSRELRSAGHRVMAVSDEQGVAAVLGGVDVDAVVVHGDEALRARVAALADETPVIRTADAESVHAAVLASLALAEDAFEMLPN